MSRYDDKNFMNFRCHLVELWCQTLTLIFSSHKSRFIQKNTGTFLYVQKTSGIFVTQKNIQKNTGTFLYLQKTPGIFLYVQNNTCMNLPYKIIPVCVQGRPKWPQCLNRGRIHRHLGYYLMNIFPGYFAWFCAFSINYFHQFIIWNMH